jgi:putative flippase GtrA
MVLLTPARRRIALFLLSGAAGFIVDLAVLMLARPWLGDIWAQVFAYGVATVVTFTANAWAFEAQPGCVMRHGTRYALSSGVSALVVNGVYVVAVLAGLLPLVALALGGGASAVVSYVLMARWVFRRH